jgi:hypothetical protein
MFDIIIQVLGYAKILITFSLFTYIYKYFYDSCSEKKIIKSKNEKPKKVIKTRIGLSFLYLALLTLLYFSLTWYIFFTLLLGTFTIAITLTHKFEPSTLDMFKKYDSHPIIKKIWYFYSLVMNIIFKIMGPCHRVLENKINKNKEKIKNGVVEQVGKMNFGGLGMGVLGSLGSMSDFTGSGSKTKNNSNKKVMVSDYNNLESFFKSQNDKADKANSKNQEPTSELNKYILSESKTKTTKSSNNEKSNAKIMLLDAINSFQNDSSINDLTVTDIEEPLDTILLNKKTSGAKKNYINNEADNVVDFLNKMKNIEKKVNKTTIKSDDDELSSFVNKNEIFDHNNDQQHSYGSDSSSNSDDDTTSYMT